MSSPVPQGAAEAGTLPPPEQRWEQWYHRRRHLRRKGTTWLLAVVAWRALLRPLQQLPQLPPPVPEAPPPRRSAPSWLRAVWRKLPGPRRRRQRETSTWVAGRGGDWRPMGRRRPLHHLHLASRRHQRKGTTSHPEVACGLQLLQLLPRPPTQASLLGLLQAPVQALAAGHHPPQTTRLIYCLVERLHHLRHRC